MGLPPAVEGCVFAAVSVEATTTRVIVEQFLPRVTCPLVELGAEIRGRRLLGETWSAEVLELVVGVEYARREMIVSALVAPVGIFVLFNAAKRALRFGLQCEVRVPARALHRGVSC